MGGKNRKKKNKNKGPAGQEQEQQRDRSSKEQGVRQNYKIIAKVNEKFEAYYKLQKVCDEDEWDDFMRTCRENLPVSFRITGSRSEAMALHHIFEHQLLKDVIEVGKEEHQVDIQPVALPWYPNRMAWQLNLSRKDVRSNEAYMRFHNFLIAETESGSISRQETVSMIPPLVLDVQPHHKVLDMCASPGSKTAQIIEMLHASNDPTKTPEGYVVANDVDNKRCYMLVHQGKRLQSPSFIVTNADASVYPRLMITSSDNKQVPLKFDRILCDVPCSGDGTIRKNVDIWRKWNPTNSFHLHQVQSQILKRGMELLAVGGLLVYSTCSMNPLEDEAVIHRFLKEAKGAVELKDINLPHLKHKNGLSHWIICDKDLQVFDKKEDVPERWQTTMRPSIFPPTPEEAGSYNLQKCLRILPHQQNTGGFFVALLSKTTVLPWEAGGTTSTLTGTSVKTEMENENGAGVEDTSPNDNDTSRNEKSGPPPAKKAKRMRGYKEDPYIFMNGDHEVWPSIRDFYKLDQGLTSTNFLKRTEEGKIKNIYLTTNSVRNFVTNNDKNIKIINVGVKALSRIDNKWSPCNFRLSQEGLPAICPYIKARRVEVTKEDLMLMLQQSDEDKAPLAEKFSRETQTAIQKLDRGSLVVVCTFPIDNDGPTCFLELVGWKGAASLRVYVQKHDRIHYLRLCGMCTSKYEINKFKEKAENEPAADNDSVIPKIEEVKTNDNI